MCVGAVSVFVIWMSFIFCRLHQRLREIIVKQLHYNCSLLLSLAFILVIVESVWHVHNSNVSLDASKYRDHLFKMCVSVHGLGEYAHTAQRDKPPHSDSMYVRHCVKITRLKRAWSLHKNTKLCHQMCHQVRFVSLDVHWLKVWDWNWRLFICHVWLRVNWDALVLL